MDYSPRRSVRTAYVLIATCLVCGARAEAEDNAGRPNGTEFQENDAASTEATLTATPASPTESQLSDLRDLREQMGVLRAALRNVEKTLERLEKASPGRKLRTGDTVLIEFGGSHAPIGFGDLGVSGFSFLFPARVTAVRGAPPNEIASIAAKNMAINDKGGRLLMSLTGEVSLQLVKPGELVQTRDIVNLNFKAKLLAESDE